MKSYEEHIETIMGFLNHTSAIQPSTLQEWGFTNENIYWMKNDPDFVSKIISEACNKNKRIHSEEIAESIEEISAIWEVC